MSVDLYFAGSQCTESTNLIIKKSLCRLYSYYNDKSSIKKWIENNVSGKLFIDSGAFTAWTKGVTINVEEYVQYINNITEYLTLFGQVDTIAGTLDTVPTLKEQEEASIKTWENYLYMYTHLKEPDKCVYTFHIGENYKYLKQALEWKNSKGEHFKYMALGGTVGKPVQDKINWFKKVWTIIKSSSNPNVKVHAFGMTSFDVLKQFPFTSADSTSWIMTGSTGSIFTSYGNVLVSDQTLSNKLHFNYLHNDAKNVICKEVEKFNYTMKELASDYKARVCYNLLYMADWAKNCNPVYNNSKTHTLF